VALLINFGFLPGQDLPLRQIRTTLFAMPVKKSANNCPNKTTISPAQAPGVVLNGKELNPAVEV
jgi:hypothetical protein